MTGARRSSRPVSRPALEQRIAAWARAYNAIIEEAWGTPHHGEPPHPVHLPQIVAAAITAAAMLTQGIDYEDD